MGNCRQFALKLKDEAQALWREVMAAGDDAAGVRARAALATELLALGKKDEATTLITEILAKDARNEQALLLRSGALPATLTIIEERTVGADLGAGTQGLALTAGRDILFTGNADLTGAVAPKRTFEEKLALVASGKATLTRKVAANTDYEFSLTGGSLA
mgnify:CR=1 FL=1